jgi:hypothetical protein
LCVCVCVCFLSICSLSVRKHLTVGLPQLAWRVCKCSQSFQTSAISCHLWLTFTFQHNWTYV